MARKITLNGQFHKPIEEVFDDFVVSQTAQGLSEITLATYHHHLRSISNHLDIQKPLEELTRKDLEGMVVSMRVAGLAHNSISSYCRVLRTFLNWCKRGGMNVPELPNIKDKETVKEAYTDEELLALLKRPKKNCSFCEYRNWVIVNFLMNSGCRSSSIRNIQNCDVDLDTRQIVLRHNKNGKIQTVPLCSQMVSILREYMPIRGGKPDDYLFCDQYGGMLSMNGLRLAVARHNQSRGVEETSVHLYRHTFARKYLVDCGGDLCYDILNLIILLKLHKRKREYIMKKVILIFLFVYLLACMTGCVSQSDLDAVTAERDAVIAERDALQAKVNLYSNIIDAMEAEEYEHVIEIVTAMMPQPEFEEVYLTEENWFDYFELDILCYTREYNADGSLNNVWLFPTYAIKEEYQERYIQAEDVFCGVSGMYCYMDVLVNEDGSYVFDYDNIIECDSREEIDASFTALILSYDGTERTGFYPEGYMVEHPERGWDIPVGEQQVIVPWNYEIIKCEGTLILKK